MHMSLGQTSGVTVAGTSGSAGSWSYQFSSPTAIMFDPNGYMYILDSGNARIQKWYPGAAYGTTILAGSLSTPRGMQLDRANNLVVADTNNHRIVYYGYLCRKFLFITQSFPIMNNINFSGFNINHYTTTQ